MSIETSIDALTTQTTELLDTCVALRSNTEAAISAAVITSVNSTQIPLIAMARNLILTQTLFINLTAK